MSKFNSSLFNEEKKDRREPYFIPDDCALKLDHFYIPKHYQENLKHLLVPHGMIVDRVEKLAYDIAQDYEGHTIHMLCVLKGKNKSNPRNSISSHCILRRIHLFWRLMQCSEKIS